MEELIRLDQEETAILMVTYDSRPASNCDKILYLPDGRIAAKQETQITRHFSLLI